MVENEDEIFGNGGTYPHLQSHRHAPSDRIACLARVLPPKPSSPTPFPPHFGAMRLLPGAALYTPEGSNPAGRVGRGHPELSVSYDGGPKPLMAPGRSPASVM